MTNTLASQLNSLLAALILLSAFAMLAQRNKLAIVHTFAWQGFLLALSTAVIGFASGEHHLYLSSLLTLTMKVILLPYILYSLLIKLKIHREIDAVVKTPSTMLIGIILVVFSYHLTAPIRELSSLMTRSTLAVALATVMLGMLMMVTRRHAITQILGFLEIENGLFFAATSATYGMPMVVELGVALDLLIAAFIFGIFFFHIRTSFDSLDVDQMAKLRETD